VSVFIATSLDGFIARENGELDWLSGPSGENGEDYGFASFLNRIDALVMGRKTFEKVMTFQDWPYGKKPVIVLTRRPLRIPQNLSGSVELMVGSPAKIVGRLAKRGFHRLYVDGGETIRGFLEAGLIHVLILTRIPILLGSGIPLFGPLRRDVALRHVKTRAFASGFVQSTYEVIDQAEAVPRRSRTANGRRQKVTGPTRAR
jgi:dihydrofolate reductase